MSQLRKTTIWKLSVSIFLYVTFSCLNLAYAADKPVLVLFPIEVSVEDTELEDEFGSSLQEGLQQRFKVYYGPAVEAELQKEYQKIDCDAERCAQNVAIAFNGELVADASASKIGSGYALKLVISNVLTGEIVETKSVPCRQCDVFAVMDQFKVMGQGSAQGAKPARLVEEVPAQNIQQAPAPKLIKAPQPQAVPASVPTALAGKNAIFIFDTKPSGATVSINGVLKGVTPYQGLQHKVGEQLDIELNSRDYKPFRFQMELSQELTKLDVPIELQGKDVNVLVGVEPYQSQAILWVDGVQKGELPAEILIAAGERSISVVRDGNVIYDGVQTVDSATSKLLLPVKATAEPEAAQTGWLGIAMRELTIEEAKIYGRNQKTVAVVGVLPDGPGARAGLKYGDLVLRYNNVDISSMSQLFYEIGLTEVGRNVAMLIQRDGQNIFIAAKIGARPEGVPANQSAPAGQGQQQNIGGEAVKRLFSTD